ncbi:winged helix-turn-helix domain-containing protein [Enterobacter sp. 186315]
MKKIINDRILYDSEKRSLSVQDQQVVLSVPTARLLALFIANNYQQLNREAIIEEVWGKHGMIPSGHTLNKNISILRKAFSGLGVDDVIITIPREGFIFQARMNNVQEKISPNVNEVILPEKTSAVLSQYRPFLLWLILGLTLFAASGFFLTFIFRHHDGIVFVLKTGACDVYTTEENSDEKIVHFLHSAKWLEISSICERKDKVVIFYDDNSLSPGNRLKEYFFSVCMMDRNGVANECENYFY